MKRARRTFWMPTAPTWVLILALAAVLSETVCNVPFMAGNLGVQTEKSQKYLMQIKVGFRNLPIIEPRHVISNNVAF